MVKFGDVKMSKTVVTEDLYNQIMGLPGGASHMPALVTEDEAAAFVKKLNDQYHTDYRIPTFTEYYSGFGDDNLKLFNEDRSLYAWSSLDAPVMMPVALKRPLAGLYDPAGNVPQIVVNSITRRRGAYPYLYVGGSYTHEYATCRPAFYQVQTPMDRMGFRICCA